MSAIAGQTAGLNRQMFFEGTQGCPTVEFPKVGFIHQKIANTNSKSVLLLW